MSSGIYALRCLLTGKVYVGSAEVWLRRIREHRGGLRRKNHANRYLQSAWDKYGAENFISELLEACPKPDLKEREQWWIDQLQSGNPKYGFNIAAAVRREMPAPQFSEIMKGYWKALSREETIARHAYKWTAKGRKLLSDNAIAQWSNPEFRANMPAKVSATMKEYCKAEEVVAHRTVISRLYWARPEAKSKMSARMTKQWAALSLKERKARSKIKPRETTRFFTLKGITRPLKEWSEESGLPYGLLLTRLASNCKPECFFLSSYKYAPNDAFVMKWL